MWNKIRTLTESNYKLQNPIYISPKSIIWQCLELIFGEVLNWEALKNAMLLLQVRINNALQNTIKQWIDIKLPRPNFFYLQMEKL